MSDTTTDDRDERLAVVFDQLMQDSGNGSAQKRLDDAVRMHPELARELRERNYMKIVSLAPEVV